MADYRVLWGDHLDTAECERNNPAWIQFAVRSYQRECMSEADEAVARLEADRNFRPSIVDCNRAYLAWQDALYRYKRLLKLDIAFSSYREDIDAEIAESRLYRVANFTRATWEARQAYRIQYGAPSRPVRVKSVPTKFVRGPNGTKIPRSKSHVPA
jgi:hypothetical protein